MSILKKILASQTVWNLSGLSYTTAVIATHGSYVSRSDYLVQCSRQMKLLEPYFDGSNVILEFGCGIGGNTISASKRASRAYGVDINSHYIKIAKKMASEAKVSNVEFISYDGIDLPPIKERPDTVFSIGVFERIPKTEVESYIHLLSKSLAPKGKLILYFLTKRAEGSQFTERLGDNAYTFWTESELKKLMTDLSLSITAWKRWPADPFTSERVDDSKSYADLLIAGKNF